MRRMGAPAAALLLMLLYVAPAAGAPQDWEDAITSGTEIFEEIPVARLQVDGVFVENFDDSLHNTTFRFTSSGPGALTYEGETTTWPADTEVQVYGLSGWLRFEDGLLRFAGFADDWVFCVQDKDEDGLGICQEEDLGTDPADADSDDDGLLDGVEVTGSANTRYGDASTDPLDADSDDDGLADGAEISAGTDPWNADTDGGGEKDGTEVTRGTDPLDATDDFYGVYKSLSEQGANGGSAMDVEWVGVDPHTTLERGVHSVAGIDLTFQHDGGQWILHNGTETHISNGFRVTLFDFRGTVNHSVEARGAGQQDLLSFSGIAKEMEVRNISNEHEVFRIKVLLDYDTSDGTLNLETYQVLDDQPVQPAQQASLQVSMPVPFYVEFDVWKNEDITTIGTYHVRLEHAHHEGQEGAWLIVYNEDPVIYQTWIPFRAPLLPFSAIKVCIQTEFPFWCGGFEQW